MKVSEALSQARRAAGITQIELAAELGISEPRLADIEAGRRPLPMKHLKRMPDKIRDRVIDAEIETLQTRINDLGMARSAKGKFVQDLQLRGIR